jgi:hypothetical protein
MSIFTRLVFAATIFVFVVSAGGHGHGCCGGESSVFGPPTETECPPAGTTLTYANFGEPFMTEYCVRCHSSQLAGPDRMGAPLFHDFDTLEGIIPVADHIDQTTASGPAATNESMPLGGATPSLEERQQLAEWIACGTPP